ncbi:hypothetical protein Tco_0840628 [Tanacetum coccineum]|uniref:Uncharacterized protein n=1 Tax=Tanacetum coccineum TaxID=301880 RepID=A0ABQ5AYG5_9ASTR
MIKVLLHPLAGSKTGAAFVNGAKNPASPIRRKKRKGKKKEKKIENRKMRRHSKPYCQDIEEEVERKKEKERRSLEEGRKKKGR